MCGRVATATSTGSADPGGRTASATRTGSVTSSTSSIRRTPSREAVLDRDPVLKVHDPEFLRAMPMRAALRSLWLWGDNCGGQEVYSLSRPVATIDIFLSHTWLTPAWLKLAGLAFYLNTHRAAAAAILLHVVMHALDFAGVYSFPLPTFPGTSRMFDGSDVVPFPRFQMQVALGMVVFFVVLWYGQELPLGRVSCFLDKCCIHQTDEGKKKAGIQQLGAFLRYSKRMVVLWEPKYFTRLWCVYELAAFIHINDRDCRKVKFFPLKLSVLAIVFSLVNSVWCSITSILFWFPFHPEHVEWVAEAVPEAAQYLYLLLALVVWTCFTIMPMSPLFWTLCKWHMKDLKDLLHQVRSFEFKGAECSEESDREFVREQIERWFGDVAKFEHYVRTYVAQRVEEMFHEQGPVPYNVGVVYCLGDVLLTSSISLAACRDGMPNYVNICIGSVGACFLAGPIAMRLTMCLAADGPSPLGQLSGSLLCAMIHAVCFSVNYALLTPAAPLWLAVLLAALQSAAACTLYFPSRAFRAMFPAALQESDEPVLA
jgi:hypothetical protein